MNLTRQDVEDGFITVRRLKGSLKTTQPLIEHPDPLFNEKSAVAVYVRNMHEKQRLFTINRKHFWRLFQKYAAAAGIPEHKRHPHVLKHSIAFATIGTGIQSCRQWLGHRSPNSTGHYLEVSDEKAAEALTGAVRSGAI